MGVRSMPREIVHIGRINAPHGVRGEMRVFPLTEDPDRFNGLKSCLLVSADERTRKEVFIRSVRGTDKTLLVSLEGIDSREEAKAVGGFFLSVERERAIALPPGRHFIFDLIGCEVFDEDGARLGILSDVMQTGANDVYIVKRPGLKDLLIPVLRSIVRRVDIEARRIDIALPEGLLSVYE